MDRLQEPANGPKFRHTTQRVILRSCVRELSNCWAFLFTTWSNRNFSSYMCIKENSKWILFLSLWRTLVNESPTTPIMYKQGKKERMNEREKKWVLNSRTILYYYLYFSLTNFHFISFFWANKSEVCIQQRNSCESRGVRQGCCCCCGKVLFIWFQLFPHRKTPTWVATDFSVSGLGSPCGIPKY